MTVEAGHLVFLRHGIAVDSEAFAGVDFARPLTEQGRKKVELIASHALAHYAPDVIVSSDILRAVQTADIVAKQFPKAERFTTPALRYTTTTQDWLLYYSAHWPNWRDKNVVAVSHDPLLPNLLGQYLHADPNLLPFKKAGLAVLKPINPENGALVAFLPPKLSQVVQPQSEDD
jgi:phosphohistidine phosphatase